MPKIPDSTKSSLQQKLSDRARERWPQLSNVDITHRAGYAYVSGTLNLDPPPRLLRGPDGA